MSKLRIRVIGRVIQALGLIEQWGSIEYPAPQRVQRLWPEEGLKRSTPGKRERPADASGRRHRPERPHQLWTVDFQCNATAVRWRHELLTVMDEHSRLCLPVQKNECPPKCQGCPAHRRGRPQEHC